MATLRKIAPPLLALVVGLGIVWAIDHVLFNVRGYQVTATFDDVSGLRDKSAVRIAGSDAGKVETIELNDDDQAVVTMRLSHGADGVGPDASATVRSVNLLGEKYVDLVPGDLSRRLDSGTGRIPVSRTGHSTDLDQVIDVLDPDTRTRLGILINEAGMSLNGRSKEFNELLRLLPPTLEDARELLAGLGADNRRLGDLVEQGDRVLAEIGPRTGDLQRLVDNAAGTLANVADRREQLGATLQEAPSTLRQARTTLTDLQGTAQRLRPAAVSLRETAPALTDTLEALPDFTQDARPALNSVTANAPVLQRLATESLPTVRRLRPTARRLDDFAGRLAPVVEGLDSGNVMRDLLRFMWGWGRVTQDEDGLGHVFGLRFLYDDTILTSAINRYGAALTGGGARKQRRGGAGGERRRAAPTPSAPVPAAAPAPAGSDRPLIQTVNALVNRLPQVPAARLPAVKLPGQDKPVTDGVQDTLDYLLAP